MSNETDFTKEILVFQAGPVTAAIPSEYVEQITDRLAVRPAKNAPAGVIGAGEFRGQPVPVIDVHARFGHSAPRRGANRKYIVLRLEERHYALQVDEVEDVLTLPSGSFKGVTIPGDQAKLGYLKGALVFGDRLIPAVDPSRMVPERKLAALRA